MQACYQKHPHFPYVWSDYILHIIVNDTIKIDTANTKMATITPSTIVYCTIIDTLKGRTFPKFDNAILYLGEHNNEKEGAIEKFNSPLIESNFVFDYSDHCRTPED